MTGSLKGFGAGHWTREVLGKAIPSVYRFSNTNGENFVTKGTVCDVNGLFDFRGNPSVASPE